MTLLFSGEPPALHPGRCLNRRHAGAGCTRCIDACPAQAIALENNTPQLNAASCVHCGICTHICPTQAFIPTVDYEKALRSVVTELPNTPIALICAVHPTPDISTLNVSVIVQHRRCLAALSIADLLELSAGGARPLWLDDMPCLDCPIGAVRSVLIRTVEAVCALLRASGRPPAVHLHSEQPSSNKTPQPLPRIDSAQPLISRRALFRRLLPKKETDVAAEMVDDLFQRGAPLSMRLPQQTPPGHLRLLSTLQTLNPPENAVVPTAHMPFAAVEVDAARCSGCELCARFCPTGALHFLTEEAHFELAFQATKCIACNLCVAACPEDAVHMQDAVQLSSLLDDTLHPLVSGELVPCTGCGALMAMRADEAPLRCYVCRQGAGVVNAQRDEAGLMADLLRRANLPTYGENS
ncbi:4Fe-4S dicluster domain-containing protein [Caldilinea sp.]|jgi:formate hydrogenlyase subunit 6/NADH:ubiquinone oxidoreductase subunit I|uniref:4Fe-4S binding protein n=1 Tax=Caldilinea sp. TaxID=2293560 RepID=UPI001B05F71D|nr:4Fe-4S dicluster domain-containing protein [Caldilinea sp.]MBO9394399.1 4Fe-4S binding protein [Caldilinea sp.]